MSYNSMIAPTKYFQGKGLLNEIYDRTCHLGKKYAFLVDDIVYNIIEAKIKKAFEGKDGEYIYIFHSGESTLEEALRIATLLRENECNIIVGVGGGARQRETRGDGAGTCEDGHRTDIRSF